MNSVLRALLLLVPLVLGPGLAVAHGPSSVALRSQVLAMDARAHAELVETADAVLQASRAGPRALPPTIDDPILAEAVWSRWLDRIAADPVLLDVERAALEALVDRPPLTWIEHHEAGLHAMPAFAVADRARALLAFDRRRREAASLLDRPEGLFRAIAPQQRFAAAGVDPAVIELALQQAPSALRVELVRRLPLEPRSALRDRALLQLARLEPQATSLLPELVGGAEPSIAREAVIEALERDDPALAELAALAAERPELGGLVVEAHLRSGGTRERLWDWLGEPELGADAARALAEHDAALVERVRERIGAAEPLARLRMLLALRLADRADADRLLAELEHADWVAPAQREALQAWR